MTDRVVLRYLSSVLYLFKVLKVGEKTANHLSPLCTELYASTKENTKPLYIVNALQNIPENANPEFKC